MAKRAASGRVLARGIILIYTIRRSHGAGVNVRDTVLLDETPCTLGGTRPWFRCPGCDRRVRALYLPPGRDHFRCRHCHRLAHGSQQVAPDGRHAIQIDKLQRQLGGDPAGMSPWSLPPKPKGMHWRTYERLCDALSRHEVARQAILRGQMERLIARSERVLGQQSAGG